jgi:hypothetical protein
MEENNYNSDTSIQTVFRNIFEQFVKDNGKLNGINQLIYDFFYDTIKISKINTYIEKKSKSLFYTPRHVDLVLPVVETRSE